MPDRYPVRLGVAVSEDMGESLKEAARVLQLGSVSTAIRMACADWLATLFNGSEPRARVGMVGGTEGRRRADEVIEELHRRRQVDG